MGVLWQSVGTILFILFASSLLSFLAFSLSSFLMVHPIGLSMLLKRYSRQSILTWSLLASFVVYIILGLVSEGWVSLLFFSFPFLLFSFFPLSLFLLYPDILSSNLCFDVTQMFWVGGILGGFSMQYFPFAFSRNLFTSLASSFSRVSRFSFFAFRFSFLVSRIFSFF